MVGALPITAFSDALILGPIEITEANTLAMVYGINKSEESKKFLDSIVEAGTVSVAAKGIISALKLVPGVNIGAAAPNAIIAGSIVAALGEGPIYAFESVCLGRKTLSDIAWVKKVMESKRSEQSIEKVKTLMIKMRDNFDEKSAVKALLELSAR